MRLSPPLFLLALLVLTGTYGCAATEPVTSNAADEEDEYEGRLFSWEFEVESDQATSQQDSSAPETTGSHTGTTSSDTAASTAKQPRRIRYSAEDDESGDRGFIIHSSDDSDYDDD